MLKQTLALVGLTLSLSANAAPVNQVDYFSLSGTELIDFQDIPTPGGSIDFDTTLTMPGVSFSERFVGQTLSYSAGSDVLSGTPIGSLTLQAGVAGENIRVAQEGSNKGIDGHSIGSLGGEGSIALLFDQDQRDVGIVVLGGHGGTATFDFWGSDGSLIHSLSTSSLGLVNYFGFSREFGEEDIAGISIWNTDPGGIGFDDISFSATTVPVPAAAWLFGAALMGLVGIGRKRRA